MKNELIAEIYTKDPRLLDDIPYFQNVYEYRDSEELKNCHPREWGKIENRELTLRFRVSFENSKYEAIKESFTIINQHLSCIKGSIRMDCYKIEDVIHVIGDLQNFIKNTANLYLNTDTNEENT